MEDNKPNDNQENRTAEPVSKDNIPIAIGCILDDVMEIKNKIEFLMQHLGMGAAGMKPVSIKEAAAFLSVSENVIRRMIREQSIPHYRRNGKTYFFEKELFEWVKESRVGTIEENLRHYQSRYKRR